MTMTNNDQRYQAAMTFYLFFFLLPPVGSKVGATYSLFVNKISSKVQLFLQSSWNKFDLEVFITFNIEQLSFSSRLQYVKYASQSSA